MLQEVSSRGTLYIVTIQIKKCIIMIVSAKCRTVKDTYE